VTTQKEAVAPLLAVATDRASVLFFSMLTHGPLEWFSVPTIKGTTNERRNTPSEVA